MHRGVSLTFFNDDAHYCQATIRVLIIEKKTHI